MKIDFPYKTHALKIEQGLHTFYVAVLPAEVLLQVCQSDTVVANKTKNGYELDGTQRIVKGQRLSEIAHYINRDDSVFPNSIIIAANHDRKKGMDRGEREDILKEKGKRFTTSLWSVSESKNGCHTLTIPSADKIAAIIDGQHRLFAFAHPNADDHTRDMNLLCSIYLDLPKSWQAQIFATINSTQRRVDRSLTFELFGYNIEDEDEKYWTPDKLAVFLTRRLGIIKESPLYSRIVIAPKRDKALEEIATKAKWRVSTAVVTDGILRLISSNPKSDSNYMRKTNRSFLPNIKRSTRSSLSNWRVKDKSPLRQHFIDGNDAFIFKVVLNYLSASEETFWKQANKNSFIIRTTGVQAIFDILRYILPEALEVDDVSVDYFKKRLQGAKGDKFNEDRFKSASGSGRVAIRKEIERLIKFSRE